MPIDSKEPDAVDVLAKSIVKHMEPYQLHDSYIGHTVASLIAQHVLEQHQAALKNKIVIDVAEVKDVPIRGIGVLVLEKLKQLEVDGE